MRQEYTSAYLVSTTVGYHGSGIRQKSMPDLVGVLRELDAFYLAAPPLWHLRKTARNSRLVRSRSAPSGKGSPSVNLEARAHRRPPGGIGRIIF
jgi:hypothetical protein